MQEKTGKTMPVSATLSRDEMAALLRVGCLGPAPHSPLHDVVPREAAHEELRELADHAWLDRLDPPRLSPEIHDGLSALASPSGHVRIVLGAAEGLGRLELYRASGGDGQRWVRWQADVGGSWAHLECFYHTDALLARIGSILELNDGFLLPRFSARWDWNRFQVLLGLVDVYRATSLRTILERGKSVSSSFGVEDVMDAIKQGLARPHYYWAVSLGRLLAPADLNISRALIAEVLGALANEEFLRAAGPDRWRLGRAITELGVSLLLVPSFLSIDVQCSDGHAQVALIRGANTLWRFAFTAKAPHDVEVSPVSGSTVAQELRTLLNRVPSPAMPAAHPATNAPHEEGGGQAQPVEERRRCVQCQASLSADARFCGRCGSRIDAVQAENVI